MSRITTSQAKETLGARLRIITRREKPMRMAKSAISSEVVRLQVNVSMLFQENIS
jgi:hypothetical protein